MTDSSLIRLGTPRESKLWSRLRPIVIAAEPSAHLVRVENVSDPGTPDVSYCVRGVEGFAELKMIRGLVRGGRMPSGTVRPAQITWIGARVRAGGLVKLVVGVAYPRPELLFIKGKDLTAALEEGTELYARRIQWSDPEGIVDALVSKG